MKQEWERTLDTLIDETLGGDQGLTLTNVVSKLMDAWFACEADPEWAPNV